jgi:hypothetical protein
MKHTAFMLLLLGVALGVGYAQTNDSIILDSLYIPESVRQLEEMEISAERPLYSVDGEKQMYNVSDDPSVQTGSASDALQNAPGVEVDAEGNITLRGAQSVEVWIDDRPSHLSGESLRQYIKTLPAGAIERIEVITNPSARYGGGGPVVNLVMRRKVKRNEFLSLGASGNLRPQVSPWVSYVYANKRFSINLYAEYDYSHTWTNQSGSSMMFTPTGDTSAIRNYTSRQDYYRHGSYFWLSGHYDIDTQRTVSFWGGAYPSLTSCEGGTNLQWQELIYSPGDYSYRSNFSSSDMNWGAFGGLDYTHRFNDEGKKLWLQLGANTNAYLSENDVTRTYDVLSILDYATHDSYPSNSGVGLSAEGGYTLPFGQKWELEVGAAGNIGTPSHYAFTSDSIIGGVAVRDHLRSFEESESSWSYSVYSTLLRRFGNLTVKLGLRGGHGHIEGFWNGHTTATVDRTYIEPLPSVHLTYRTKNMHNFSLSWTRRVSAPDAGDLTPFITYGTESYSVGNPDLKLTVSHNLEGRWDKYYDKFGSVGAELFWRAEQDAISSIGDVAYSEVFGREVSYTMPHNIGDADLAGGTLNITYRPTAFFNLRLSASAYNYHYRLQFRPGEWSEDAAWSGRVRLNAWTKLWDVLQLFGTVSYTTRQIAPMNIHEPTFRTDLGVSADLLDRRLSLYLNVKDVFGSVGEEWQTTNPYYQGGGRRTYGSQYISFGLTLRFGKMELESQARTGNSGN